MARRPRLDLPGVPQHVIQRGNNRNICFFHKVDYVNYLRFLNLAREKADCRVHAYVLMTNHVHLLVSGNQAGSMAVMMQSLGRRYVRYVNDRYERTGSLWEGRYRSTLVDSDRYLLACYRYLELNPVRAGIVRTPGDYRWSSYAHHANQRKDPLIDDHEVFLAVHSNPAERGRWYRALCREALGEKTLQAIRHNTHHGYVLGSKRFAKRVSTALGRRVTPGRAGRPEKKLGSENHF